MMSYVKNIKKTSMKISAKKNMKITTTSVAMVCFSVVVLSALSACNDNTNNRGKTGLTKAAQTQVKQDNHVAAIWPKLTFEVKKSADVEARINKILAKMTLAQKVAQMIQPEIRDITVEDMRTYGFGSYLNGGGAFPQNNKHATPKDWIKLAEDFYQASMDDAIDGIAIPTMWGTDAVHGHNNVIGATLFPHNIGLGAMHDADLVEKIAQATATEVMVTGIDWVFAPTVAVVRDDRWGRTYEGYSEDPQIVKSYSAAMVRGLQGHAGKDFLNDQHVISTVKHFLGDGGTENGIDQGDNLASESDLFKLHAQGYVGGLSAGAQSVMASFNSWHGKKNHGNKYLLTEVLKDRMGFDGFVVGDWNGHGQVAGCTNESCPQAVNAGLDIFMVPTKAWKPLYENTIAQVKSGEIAQSRIDDAVKRILRVKIRAGLFEKPSPAKRKFSGKTALIGSKAHRDIARQAVRESLVLLKNKGILPLSLNQHILVTGDGADNIGKQAGGWSITWQGTGNKNADFPGATSIYAGIKAAVAHSSGSVELSNDASFKQKPDVAIVVFGEDPYAEGNGDIDNLDFQRGDKKALALLKTLKAQHIPVVSVFLSGRPLWVNAELNASDAFVAAWLPGTEGQGIADVLLRKVNGEINYDFVGKLSYSWPATPEQTKVNRFDANYQPLLPYGYGLRYLAAENQSQVKLSDNLPEKVTNTATDQSVNILTRAVQKPWRVVLHANKQDKIVNSNVQTLGAVTLKTSDRHVQEDARQLSFSGSEMASVGFESNFPRDLRSTVENNLALQFSYKVNQIAKKDAKKRAIVHLGMQCQFPSEGNDKPCGASIDINENLHQATVNEWQQMSVDMACYQQLGVNMAKVTSPFTLSTNAKLSIEVSDVVIKSVDNNETKLACPQLP
jgi:beta-glucosidase